MVDNDMPWAWPVWTPGTLLAAFIKESIIHYSTQNMKALGHTVLEKKIFFMFSNCKSMGAIDPPPPGVGPFLTPGACLAGFM